MEGIKLFVNICNKAWKEKKMPKEWKTGVILQR